MNEELDRLAKEIGECLSLPVHGLRSDELVRQLDRVQAITRGLATLQLRLVREVEVRSAATAGGCTGGAQSLGGPKRTGTPGE